MENIINRSVLQFRLNKNMTREQVEVEVDRMLDGVEANVRKQLYLEIGKLEHDEDEIEFNIPVEINIPLGPNVEDIFIHTIKNIRAGAKVEALNAVFDESNRVVNRETVELKGFNIGNNLDKK